MGIRAAAAKQNLNVAAACVAVAVPFAEPPVYSQFSESFELRNYSAARARAGARLNEESGKKAYRHRLIRLST